jgi:hypothetical protein
MDGNIKSSDEYKIHFPNMPVYAQEALKQNISLSHFLANSIGLDVDVVEVLTANWNSGDIAEDLSSSVEDVSLEGNLKNDHWFTKRENKFTRRIVYVLVALRIAFHFISDFSKINMNILPFFLWCMIPYGIVLFLAFFLKGSFKAPLCAAFIFAFDVWTYWSGKHGGGEAALLGVMFMPIFDICLIPFGLLIGGVFEKVFRYCKSL